METLLITSQYWARKVQIEWLVEKSCRLQLRGLVELMGHVLQDRNEDTYLGLSSGKHSLTKSKLLGHFRGVIKLLSTLGTVSQKWKFCVGQRRTFVKTFIYIMFDYILYLQPVLEELGRW